MPIYKLSENDEILVKGSFLDCWKGLLSIYGDEAVKSLIDKNIKIEPKE